MRVTWNDPRRASGLAIIVETLDRARSRSPQLPFMRYLLRLSWGLLGPLGFLVAVGTASATLMVGLSMEELAHEADVIVVATVVRQEALWDDHQRIVTDVTLRVDEAIKGSLHHGDPLVVRRLGGVVGDVAMRVEGEATFEDGERALLFAQRFADGRLRAVGMSQGLMPIEGDRVLPGGAGAALLRRDTDGVSRGTPPALITSRPLTEVLAELRQILRLGARAIPDNGRPGTVAP